MLRIPSSENTIGATKKEQVTFCNEATRPAKLIVAEDEERKRIRNGPLVALGVIAVLDQCKFEGTETSQE